MHERCERPRLPVPRTASGGATGVRDRADVDRILELQRLAGNAATRTLLERRNTNDDGPVIQRFTGCPHNNLWGGFEIRGDCNYIGGVRDDLNKLNQTSVGGRLLRLISDQFRDDPILIRSMGNAAGYRPPILAWAPGYQLNEPCAPNLDSPSHVTLFHELGHLYMHRIQRVGNWQNECLNVGIGYRRTFSENSLRCELSLAPRPCYTGDGGRRVPCRGRPPGC